VPLKVLFVSLTPFHCLSNPKLEQPRRLGGHETFLLFCPNSPLPCVVLVFGGLVLRLPDSPILLGLTPRVPELGQ
jgi:hypothetical protein